MPRYVVTGAAGFIGSHLCDRLLADGGEVLGVDCFTDHYGRDAKERNLERSRAYDRFRLMEADLARAELAPVVEGAEAVFHLAGQPGVRASWGRTFERYTNDNVLATQRLLEECRESRPRVVLASTSSVYGEHATLPMREDANARPHSPYGVTKLAAEGLARLYHANFGVPATILRFFTAYGPRQRPDMGFHRFITAGLEGSPVTLYGDGSQTRDFTFVSDVVDGIVASLASEPGETLNVGGGHNVVLADALRIIGDALGRPLDLRHVEPASGDVHDTLADNSRLRTLGWEPRTSLEQGVAAQVAWMREELADR